MPRSQAKATEELNRKVVFDFFSSAKLILACGQIFRGGDLESPGKCNKIIWVIPEIHSNI
jgi:hypothetical protein